MTSSRGAVSFALAVLMVGVGCGGRRQASRDVCPKPRCRGDADAGAAASPARPAAGVTPPPARPSAGRRLQHFALLAAARDYRSHRSCVALVNGALPPELTREADPSNLAERVCQTRRALAEKSVALCEEIHDPYWPRACRRLYATLYGKPEACPPREQRDQGRDPSCVALATRDPALCRAVRSLGGQQRCRAILGPASGCRALRTTAEVRSCELDRKRWRSVLRPVKKPALVDKYAPRYELSVVAGGRTVKGAGRALEHGVVLPEAGAGGRWLLGALQPAGEQTALDRRLAVLLDLPPPAKLPASLPVGAASKGARLCALWKGKPVSPAQVKGKVELTGFESRRGARVVGSYDVTLSLGDETVRVSATFDTYVRDTVPGAWATTSCADRLAVVAPARPASAARPGEEPEGHPCFFVAHWKGLRQVGYRVYGVRPRGRCARLGLVKGDVVVAVGQRPATRWADVQALYRLMASGKPLAVTVLRRDKRRVLKTKGL